MACALLAAGLSAEGQVSVDTLLGQPLPAINTGGIPGVPVTSMSLPPPEPTPPDQGNVPGHRDVYREFEQFFTGRGRPQLHTAIRPYRYEQFGPFLGERFPYRDLRPLAGRNGVERAWNYVAFGHVLSLEREDFRLYVDPLVEFTLGADLAAGAEELYVNTRGVVAKGHIGQKVTFETSFRENQAKLPAYLTAFVQDNRVVPGQGRTRRFKVGGVDYANAMGYVSWSPSRFFNAQLGHGQQFIGDGYRSLLLSDNAYPAPYLQLRTRVWRLEYLNLFTQYTDLDGTSNFITGFPRKYASFHYLSYMPTDWLQVGLFEAVVWQGSDSGYVRGFDPNYLNPVIFYRPVEFGLGSPDNASLGLNLKATPFAGKAFGGLAFYGQVFLDDLDIARSREGEGFYRNKLAWQAGLKWFRPWGVENLFVRAEYNRIRPYVYAHKVPRQSYTHYNQPLAHPLGANADEFVAIVAHRVKRFYGEAKLTWARYGEDTLGSHYGKDLDVSDFDIPGFPEVYGVRTLQGVDTRVVGSTWRAGYLINPVARLAVELRVDTRHLRNANGRREEMVWLQAGLRTNLFPRYYDF